MRIAIGSDHAGYQLKRLIMDHLYKQGIACEDYGAPNGIDAASYVPFGQAVANAVISGAVDYGIAICGTGLGISMTTNKIKGTGRRCASTNIWLVWLGSTTMPMFWRWAPVLSARRWLVRLSMLFWQKILKPGVGTKYVLMK